MEHVICQYDSIGQSRIESLLFELKKATSVYIYGAGKRGKALFDWLKYTDVADKIGAGCPKTN